MPNYVVGLLLIIVSLLFIRWFVPKAQRINHEEREAMAQAVILLETEVWMIDDVDELYGGDAYSVDLRRLRESSSSITIFLEKGDRNYDKFREIKSFEPIRFVACLTPNRLVPTRNPSRHVELVPAWQKEERGQAKTH